MNSRAKGWRTKQKFIKYITELGWIADTVEKTGRFVKQKDMFGLFDVVAVKNSVMFVQITTNSPHIHKTFIQWSKDYNIKGLSIIQAVWYDRKDWKFFKYSNGKKTIIDLRRK